MCLVSKVMQAKNTDLFLTWSLMGGNTLRGGSRAMNSWRWVWPLDLRSEVNVWVVMRLLGCS